MVRMVMALLGGIVRDLSWEWVRSAIVRLALIAALTVVVAAAFGFVVAAAHTALTVWIGPVYASLSTAAGLLVIALGLVAWMRMASAKARQHREKAVAQASALLMAVRAATTAIGRRHGALIALAALVLGFAASRATGGRDEANDRSTKT